MFTKNVQMMMRVQGKMRVVFITKGVEPEKAGELAGEALHVFMTSDLAEPEARQEYEESLESGQEEEH